MACRIINSLKLLFSLLANSNASSSSPAAPSPVTNSSTGPDGVPIHDETSQQSTLSQNSDRSDGGRHTPKGAGGGGGSGAGNFMPPQGGSGQYSGGHSGGGGGGGGGPPGSPHSSAPSPGGSLGSGGGGHENSYGGGRGDMSSPNWNQNQQQRQIASPAPQVRSSETTNDLDVKRTVVRCCCIM
jgi:hypothetical protein